MTKTTTPAPTNGAETTTAAPAAKSTPHFATRDFNDAGTTRSFKAGAELTECSDGEIANYVAARLASADKPAA
ncbi:hypothetical protein GCM10011380_08850 [Sphingomonas metalli]|uniref:Uncharacterized protein n=1 Tax=Sphingomonas metalli TaxID=1779358 RepID=A0A916WP99_9SPHN|nr:hypothetical protein [Sphingomonas metalli]GGB21503.1 hypothetical protein GCM10011380_08850 [Sphingomonas metalli]